VTDLACRVTTDPLSLQTSGKPFVPYPVTSCPLSTRRRKSWGGGTNSPVPFDGLCVLPLIRVQTISIHWSTRTLSRFSDRKSRAGDRLQRTTIFFFSGKIKKNIYMYINTRTRNRCRYFFWWVGGASGYPCTWRRLFKVALKSSENLCTHDTFSNRIREKNVNNIYMCEWAGYSTASVVNFVVYYCH